MSVVTIGTQQDFEEKVLKSEQPVLVDFWAPWCGPCKMVGPELDAVAETYVGKAMVAKINVDDHQQLAGKYNVMGVPTLLIIKNGHEVERIVGYRPRKDISAALDAIL